MSECIVYAGHRDKNGYGKVWYKKKRMLVHRLAWIQTYGEIVNGLFVCHHCDNPGCFNINHLFLGTQQDNMNDMKAKGRQVSIPLPGERNPMAKLTERNVHRIRILNALFTDKTIAEIFNVTRETIRDIRRRKTWKHI